MTTTSNTPSQTKRGFNTHFYSKSDLMGIWNIRNEKQFLNMIGKSGQEILNWKAGKMRFTPKQVRRIINLVGAPLKKEEYVW